MKHHIKAVMGTHEIFEDIEIFDTIPKHGQDDELFRRKQQLGHQLVRDKGEKQPRGGDKKATVVVFELGIKAGKLVEQGSHTMEFLRPTMPTTAEEYAEDLAKVLKNTPAEFHDFVTTEAYDRGHDDGYDECLSIAKGLVNVLRPCFLRFEQRICKTLRAKKEKV